MTAIIAPGNYEAALFKADNFRLILRRTDITIYPELIDNLRSICIQDTCPDIIATASTGAIVMTATTVVTPGDHKATITEGADRRLILTARVLIRINPELLDRFRAIRIEDTRPDIVTAAAVMTAVITPGHHKTATFKANNFRLILG